MSNDPKTLELPREFSVDYSECCKRAIIVNLDRNDNRPQKIFKHVVYARDVWDSLGAVFSEEIKKGDNKIQVGNLLVEVRDDVPEGTLTFMYEDNPPISMDFETQRVHRERTPELIKHHEDFNECLKIAYRLTSYPPGHAIAAVDVFGKLLAYGEADGEAYSIKDLIYRKIVFQGIKIRGCADVSEGTLTFMFDDQKPVTVGFETHEIQR